mgnify:CR=1 FL=1|tara:strand:- start:35456 stop:35833 length:378 start_codon:yes stop_codon:yes gene_type:complete
MSNVFNPVCDYQTVPNEDSLPNLSKEDNGLHIIVGHKRNGYVYRFQWNNRSESGSWNKVYYFDKGSVLDQLFKHEQKETERMYLKLRKFIEDKNTPKEDSDKIISLIKEEKFSIKQLYKSLFHDE